METVKPVSLVFVINKEHRVKRLLKAVRAPTHACHQLEISKRRPVQAEETVRMKVKTYRKRKLKLKER